MPDPNPAYLPPRSIHVDVRVSRVMSNTDNPRPIRLTVTDKASGYEFLEVRFTREEWADVVTGHSTYDPGAKAETRGLWAVGLRHEHQSQTFGGHGSDDFGAAEAEAWAVEMLANGWHTKSAHRNNRAQTVMTVRRYLEPEAASDD